jgi:hypothetical protein
MMPLLYWHLNEAAADAVPDVELESLRREFKLNAAHNLQLAAELLEILKLFEARGIPALPYKGPVLAQCLYGTLALRQIGDIDILLHEGDVAAARALLVDRNYQSSHWRLSVPGALRFEYQHKLKRKQGGVLVELHWTIAPRSVAAALGLNELWDRREGVSLLGATVQTITGGDLLLVLCIHGSKHLWRRLEWICGVAELLRSGSVDWDRLIERSTQLGSGRMLRLGLSLAHELLDAPLPDAVLRQVRADPHVPALAASARARLFGEPVGMGTQSRVPHSFYLRVKERAYDKLRYLYYEPLTRAVRRTSSLADRLFTSGRP